MKSSRNLYLLTAASMVFGFSALPLAHGTGAISTKTNQPPSTVTGKAGATGTNAEPAELPVPVSVFDLSSKPTKDPFFPNSLRPPVRDVGPKAQIGINANSFQLMSMGGSRTDPLAMINHRTLGLGEAMEVPVIGSGKVTIRVMQIKENSVIIRVVTPPQPDLIELSLAKRAQ